MKKLILLLALCYFNLECSKQIKNSNNGQISTTLSAEETENIYAQYCSSCHGEKLQAFVDRKWKHGNGISDLTKSITNGYPDDGMPSWKGVLSSDQIAALALAINKNLETVDQYNFDKEPKTNVFENQSIKIKLDTLATDFESPWGMCQLPDNQFLITDRSGKLYLVGPGRKKTEIPGIPKVMVKGQGGLLDVILHPNFESNQYIYLSYSKPNKEEDMYTTAICRAKFDGKALTNLEDIFIALPYAKTSHHYGSRMAFDKENKLFFSVGDRGNRDQNPQNLDNHCGKIHRINDDGSIPEDNPFAKTNPKFGSIYSYGHRNPQGLIYDTQTGILWETEHGPRGGDELNKIEKGKNYGWPLVSYGINYDGTTFTNKTSDPGMIDPIVYWIPSIAPCGLAMVNSNNYEKWKGDLLVGSLRFNYLNRCDLVSSEVSSQEKLLINVGRVRNVYQAKDGYLYLSTEKPGNVYRLISY